MRAVVAIVSIVALLASPQDFGAFLLGTAGPAAASSASGPPPPGPHILPSFLPGSLPEILIVEVFYFAYRDDEYIVLANPRSSPVRLEGWRLTDLEGAVAFPAGAHIPGRDRIVVTRNATSYAEDTLDDPEFTYGPGVVAQMVTIGAIPRLNNEGDEVLLLDPAGAVVDALVYGNSRFGGAGWIGRPAIAAGRGERAVRAVVADTFVDSDTAVDWESPRTHRLGQSDVPFIGLTAEGEVTALLSPDNALSVLRETLDRAHSRIWASLYTLTSPDLSGSIQAAAARGVDVRILLEGAPVGGIDPRQWSNAESISSAGAAIRFLADAPGDGTFARYRFLHAKYAVIDLAVFIGSENWGEHGFPAEGRVGNRGWHVLIQDAKVAAYFEALFLEDYEPRRRDSVPLAGFSPQLAADREPVTNGTRPARIVTTRVAGPIWVTPVVVPDHAFREDAVLGLLRSAVRTLDVESFHVARTWGEGPNPYFEAVIEAARRGIRVRVLLDGTWYNAEEADPFDNDDTVAYLNEIAREERLPLEAKLIEATGHGLAKVHNKGVLVDDERVFVSSLNWNQNAATRNREIGIIVESAALAAPFRLAFEEDWRDEPGRSILDAPAGIANPLILPLVTVLAVNIALLWARFRRRRATTKGLSDGDEME